MASLFPDIEVRPVPMSPHLRNRMERLSKMHLSYGRVDGETCGSCQHFYRPTRRYAKCAKAGDSGGPASDWSGRWTACGLKGGE